MSRHEFAELLAGRPDQSDEIRALAIKGSKKEVLRVGKGSPRNVDMGRMMVIDEVLKEFYNRA